MRAHSFASDLLFGVRDGSSSVRRACVDSSSESFDDVPTGGAPASGLGESRVDARALGEGADWGAVTRYGGAEGWCGGVADADADADAAARAGGERAEVSRAEFGDERVSLEAVEGRGGVATERAVGVARGAFDARAGDAGDARGVGGVGGLGRGDARWGRGSRAVATRARPGHPAYAPMQDVKLPEELRAEHVPVRANLAVVV